MATRLDFPFVVLTFSRLCFLLILAGLRYARMLSGRLVSFPYRFFLCPVLYPTTLPLVHLPDWTLFLSCTFTAFAPLCTCISQTCIYTGLEMG